MAVIEKKNGIRILAVLALMEFLVQSEDRKEKKKKKRRWTMKYIMKAI